MCDLPTAFLEQMRLQLGQSSQAYIDALEMPYVRGVRLNPRKPVPKECVQGLQENVPWNAPFGFYLDNASEAGAHCLHECGAYYIQEPSAMAPVRVLNVQPGETVLDLCAAPGGKSTQLADAMRGEGLLVCNEPVPSRAKILSRNLERMGVSNSLCVSADPDVLAPRWPALFDAVLVDAPCSGEGMFRRHPETRDEWTPDAPAMCAARQSRILDAAEAMTRPGGRLVYSTCTHNRTEDEGSVEAFLQHHPDWAAVPFELLGAEGPLHAADGMLHLYPHEVKGEGHFVALLQKGGEAEESDLPDWPQKQLAPVPKAMQAAYAEFARAFGDVPMPNAMLGDAAVCAPNLPPLSGIRVLRAGVQLGTLKGKVFAPDHALALSLPAENGMCVPLSEADAERYQHGDALPCADGLRGWVLLSCMGLPLGFGKASDGQIKNHYPKGLRRP